MPAQLDSVATGFQNSSSENCRWGHTFPTLGSTGLFLIAGVGREEGGDENPEEFNVTEIVGHSPFLTPIFYNGNERTGGGLGYLKGPQLPAPGSYTVGINFKDSPKQAEYKRGISAIFRNVYNQPPEASNQMATNQNNSKSLSLTTITPNALLIAVHWWRVGFQENPVGNGFIQAAVNRGDNSAGVSLYYKTVPVPGLETFTVDAGNTESQGIIMAAFRTTSKGAGFLAHFM